MAVQMTLQRVRDEGRDAAEDREERELREAERELRQLREARMLGAPTVAASTAREREEAATALAVAYRRHLRRSFSVRAARGPAPAPANARAPAAPQYTGVTDKTMRMRRYFEGTYTERATYAASTVAAAYRGHKLRKTIWGEHHYTVNLQYEIIILRKRMKRRGTAIGFVQHVCYMLLLFSIMLVQTDGGPHSAYQLESTLQQYVENVETPGGLSFESVATVGDFSEWFREGFMATLTSAAAEGEEGTIYLQTYNRIVGALQVEVQRVDGIACPWKVGGWRDTYPVKGEHASSGDGCFPRLIKGSTEDTDPFGPWYDDERYHSRFVFGESRYTALVGEQNENSLAVGASSENRLQYAMMKLNDLDASGFFDPRHTRRARVRILTYNNGLARPMLCALTIEARLSPTGVLSTEFKTAAVPVQEYMQANKQQLLALEIVFLVWTLAQIAYEFIEFRYYMKKTGSPARYLSDVYNSLDWLRFACVVAAVSVRVMIITDGSRSFDLATTQYIDCENVVKLYDVYKLLICFGCACVLLSTVQYFDLNERLRAMKGTLSRSGAELFPFMAVLSLFFLTYTLIGMYLFGSTLSEFKDFPNSVTACFALMLGINGFADLEQVAPREEEGITAMYVALIIYYYSFVFLHFFVLLNMVIAIVVDAYVDVKNEGKTKVNSLLKRNMGPLDGEMALLTWRQWLRLRWWAVQTPWLDRFLHGLAACLFSCCRRVWYGKRKDYIDEYKPVLFVPWSDEEWMSILTTIVEKRKRRGFISRQIKLSALAREVRLMQPDELEASRRFKLDSLEAYLARDKAMGVASQASEIAKEVTRRSAQAALGGFYAAKEVTYRRTSAAARRTTSAAAAGVRTASERVKRTTGMSARPEEHLHDHTRDHTADEEQPAEMVEESAPADADSSAPASARSTAIHRASTGPIPMLGTLRQKAGRASGRLWRHNTEAVKIVTNGLREGADRLTQMLTEQSTTDEELPPHMRRPKKDIVFQQTAYRFYSRPYFQPPDNLNNPMDEHHQPSSETWSDSTLGGIADKVGKMELRSIQLVVQMQTIFSALGDLQKARPAASHAQESPGQPPASFAAPGSSSNPGSVFLNMASDGAARTEPMELISRSRNEARLTAQSSRAEDTREASALAGTVVASAEAQSAAESREREPAGFLSSIGRAITGGRTRPAMASSSSPYRDLSI